ncbi:signal peptidase I [Halobaculum rubrum]|uniref:signal peptidase I n=1 Tax=Halobaculum rubrum TaxID=2872158 RepID=UPI001CA3D9CA|nr:signal peptidase I [Halobaculum rubrum]QZX98985.1 signal peptidase I [Halobaculum rubrum]
MDARRLLTLGSELLLVVVVVSLVAGQLLGQPILLSYVETGSMAPTMEPGDGFIAVPAAVAGDPEPGDVVTFDAQELNGGGLTTHRVVGETERGYVTRGDANPFTDQDGSEPPVKDAQIVAHALRVGGTVVVIPELGTAVMGIRGLLTGAQRWLAATVGSRSLLGTQGIAYVVLALSALGYVVDLLRGGPADGPDRTRSTDRDDGVSTRLILVGLAAMVVVSATAAMVVPAGTQEFGIVSAEFDSENPTVIRQGGASTIEYRVPNAGLVPVHSYVRPASDGVAVSPEHVFVEGRGESTVSITLSAPDETGYYRRYVAEHRYLAVLPEPLIRDLSRAHPWLPIVAIDAMLGGGIYGLGRLLIDGGRTRIRSRDARYDRPIAARIRRLLTR